MSDIHRIPDLDQAEREASEWIARFQSDDVSDDDRARFENWKKAHPQHARAYEAVAQTWAELAKDAPLVRAVSYGEAMNAASKASGRRRGWAVAASVMLIAVVGLVAGTYWRQHKAATLFQTAIGEHAAISLPDGSSVDLNSNSLARIDYTPQARVVFLERGEAYFKVAHDTQRPFWVVAGRSWVRAVGTAFNVYLHASKVEVTVSEGTVKVASQRSNDETPSDRVLGATTVSVLNAGEQVEVGEPAAVIRNLQPEQLKRSVAWRGGTVNFENQPLGEVVDEMRRYTTMSIEVIDPNVRQLVIGGTFRANPEGAEALLKMLQDGFGLSVKRERPDRVRIEGVQDK